MDIVICLAKKDFRIVKKTVRYLKKYIQKDKDYIYLICPKSLSKCYCSYWKNKYNVVFIAEDTLLPGLSYKAVDDSLKAHFKIPYSTGWYYQQFLKMGFAISSYAKDQYLIWDSDLIPLRTIPFEADGKYLLACKTENHAPYFYTMNQLLGYGKSVDFSFIAEHMVIKTSIMKDLITTLNNCNVSGKVWYEKIINATSGVDDFAFSEFETYGTFCVHNYPDLFKIHELKTFREAGYLFGRGVTDGELESLEKIGYDTASFEYYHVPSFPRSLINKIERHIANHL